MKCEAEDDKFLIADDHQFTFNYVARLIFYYVSLFDFLIQMLTCRHSNIFFSNANFAAQKSALIEI